MGVGGKVFPWVSLVDVDFEQRCSMSFEDTRDQGIKWLSDSSK